MSKKKGEEKVDIVSELNTKFGAKIAYYSDDNSTEKIDVIPTSILPLDFALGIGGIPRGRITDIYGLPSVGKSTVSFSIIAQAQKMGLECALIDAEYSYRPEYASKFGIDTEKLLIIQPDTLEQAGEAIEALIRAKMGLIVVDSVSSLIPRALAEAEHGKSPMALQARGMSQMLLKIIAPLSKFNTALICINQMRINIMAMHPGEKYTVTGGYALKFYSSIRLEIKKLKGIMKGENLVGYQVGFTVKKNKLARPGGECVVPYMLEEGFLKDGDLVQMGIDGGVIEQAGAWFTMKGERYQGKEKVAQAIEADATLKKEIISLLFPQ